MFKNFNQLAKEAKKGLNTVQKAASNVSNSLPSSNVSTQDLLVQLDEQAKELATYKSRTRDLVKTYRATLEEKQKLEETVAILSKNQKGKKKRTKRRPDNLRLPSSEWEDDPSELKAMDSDDDNLFRGQKFIFIKSDKF